MPATRAAVPCAAGAASSSSPGRSGGSLASRRSPAVRRLSLASPGAGGRAGARAPLCSGRWSRDERAALAVAFERLRPLARSPLAEAGGERTQGCSAALHRRRGQAGAGGCCLLGPAADSLSPRDLLCALPPRRARHSFGHGSSAVASGQSCRQPPSRPSARPAPRAIKNRGVFIRRSLQGLRFN